MKIAVISKWVTQIGLDDFRTMSAVFMYDSTVTIAEILKDTKANDISTLEFSPVKDCTADHKE